MNENFTPLQFSILRTFYVITNAKLARVPMTRDSFCQAYALAYQTSTADVYDAFDALIKSGAIVLGGIASLITLEDYCKRKKQQ